jgi:hypothetical protein
MFEDYPVEYFWGLITLANVLKIETGQPGHFDKPRTREEALDRAEAAIRTLVEIAEKGHARLCAGVCCGGVA